MNTAILLWGVLFSAIGLGLFVYGKKQQKIVPIVCGIALMVYPYFVENTYVFVAIGVALASLPFFVRL